MNACTASSETTDVQKPPATYLAPAILIYAQVNPVIVKGTAIPDYGIQCSRAIGPRVKIWHF